MTEAKIFPDIRYGRKNLLKYEYILYKIYYDGNFMAKKSARYWNCQQVHWTRPPPWNSVCAVLLSTVTVTVPAQEVWVDTSHLLLSLTVIHHLYNIQSHILLSLWL